VNDTNVSSAAEPAASTERALAERWIRHAWLTAVAHAGVSAAVLLMTGRNLVLSAHYPLLSALVLLLLAFGVRRGSRTAALLLFVGVLTPALIKLLAGVLDATDIPAFPLAALYGRGVAGAFRRHRLLKRRPGGGSPVLAEEQAAANENGTG